MDAFFRFASPQQRFPLCSKQEGFEISGCLNVGTMEILYYPLLVYLAWQLLYILVVSVANKILIRNYVYNNYCLHRLSLCLRRK